jgi:non-heme chloroperoxidase
MPFITAKDGTQLFWREWGQGAPILFLNSLGCNNQMWDYQFIAFAEQGFRCIGLDRRGHGKSDQPAHGYECNTFADDTATLIEQLNFSGLTLIGHSMAAFEMIRYLTRHGSHRIGRMVLLSPMTPMLLQTKDNSNGLPRAAFEAVWTQWERDYPKWVEDETPPFLCAGNLASHDALGGQRAAKPCPNLLGLQPDDGGAGLSR